MRRILACALCLMLGMILGTTLQTATAVTDSNVAALEKKIVDLDRRLNALEAVIKISGSSVNIEGTDITIKAFSELKLKGAKITQN